MKKKLEKEEDRVSLLLFGGGAPTSSFISHSLCFSPSLSLILKHQLNGIASSGKPVSENCPFSELQIARKTRVLLLVPLGFRKIRLANCFFLLLPWPPFSPDIIITTYSTVYSKYLCKQTLPFSRSCTSVLLSVFPSSVRPLPCLSTRV